ncbi:MAG: FkbM family methyltransferase [Pseudomonadota bacterium]|nr:FkbM family methyltransferase [Pseudomonadota bacterium]
MNPILKNAIKKSLRTFNLALVNHAYFEYLERTQIKPDDLKRIAALPGADIDRLLQLLPRSKAQLRQDLFVLSQLKFKENGYFVEFGATNGVSDSNTHLLEKEFGWTGILAEPARCWQEALRRNRSGHVETRCVWSASDQTLTFNEVDVAALSTIDTYSSQDMHREARTNGNTYEVQTISLQDLLEKYAAPSEIDYLSVDTEGSEFEILSNFDFDRYRFKVISCEHNFTPMRGKLHALLTSKGYVRTLQQVSSVDDWYVREDLIG